MSARVIPFPRRGEPSPAACAASLRRRAADVRVLAAQHLAAVSALETEAEQLEHTAAMALGEPYTPPARLVADPRAAKGRIDWTSGGPLPEWLLEFPPSEDLPRPEPRCNETPGSSNPELKENPCEPA